MLAYRGTFSQSKRGFWVRSTYGTTYLEISGIRPAVPEYSLCGPAAWLASSNSKIAQAAGNEFLKQAHYIESYQNAHLSTAAIIHSCTVCTSTAAELAIQKKREFIMGPVGPTVLL